MVFLGALMDYIQQHLQETMTVIQRLDPKPIEATVGLLQSIQSNQGRVFFLGVGGSAANCSHAVCDFRKLLKIEAYAVTDNVAEVTARTNDEGWASVFLEWLKVSNLSANDAVFIFSVGGGDIEKQISPNLVMALQFTKEVGAKIIGIVGRDGGFTAQVADACIKIPVVNPETITPHTEAFQAVIWHLLVSHPKLKKNQTTWESDTHFVKF
jgi:D-sedoheptulose 7-phosphate isomerase